MVERHQSAERSELLEERPDLLRGHAHQVVERTSTRGRSAAGAGARRTAFQTVVRASRGHPGRGSLAAVGCDAAERQRPATDRLSRAACVSARVGRGTIVTRDSALGKSTGPGVRFCVPGRREVAMQDGFGRRAAGLWVALSCLFGACSADDGTLQAPLLCTPGQGLTCPCFGGGNGMQTCLPDGTGYGICLCQASAAAGMSMPAGDGGRPSFPAV